MIDKKLTVGFLTGGDPLDKRTWSGTTFRMYDTLLNDFDVVPLGPEEKPHALKLMLLFLDVFHRLVFKGRFNRQHNHLLSRFYSRRFDKKISKLRLGCIFAPAASTEIALLKTDLPIVYLSDSSFGQLEGYYGNYSSLSNRSKAESNLIEMAAIQKSIRQVYSSEWAANYVIENYNADPKQVNVIPFGANIDYIPDLERINARDYSGSIQIIFLGVDWERKGGMLAYEAFLALLDQGYDVFLTICGCNPPIQHDRLTVIPFLNKNNSEENEVFMSLMYRSHILFVPTRAECTPIAFCEAGSFGLPIVSTRTGGVESIVKNNINGLVLPYDARPENYADGIAKLLDDRGQLLEMSKNSRNLFESTFNWNAWAKQMGSLFRGL